MLMFNAAEWQWLPVVGLNGLKAMGVYPYTLA